MKTFNSMNAASILLIYLGAILFIFGGTLALLFDTSYMMTVMAVSFCMVLISVPFTIASLMAAAKLRVVSTSYVVLSIVASLFIAGLGWLVIPFAVRRDMRDYLAQVGVEEVY